MVTVGFGADWCKVFLRNKNLNCTYMSKEMETDTKVGHPESQKVKNES